MTPPDTLCSHILVVDDDMRLRTLVQRYLIRESYWCSCAKDAVEAKKLLQMLRFDLIIMDIMMPEVDGLTLTSQIRQTKEVPIIILSAKNEVEDKIKGLNTGADDYLPKPFEPSELIARIEAILRRTKSTQGETEPMILEFGDFQYDPNRRLLRKMGQVEQVIYLTELEQKLMQRLAQTPNRAVSRDNLMIGISDEKGGIQDRAIDVRISRLREKIEPNVKHPSFLITVRNQGYMLVAQQSSSNQ